MAYPRAAWFSLLIAFAVNSAFAETYGQPSVNEKPSAAVAPSDPENQNCEDLKEGGPPRVFYQGTKDPHFSQGWAVSKIGPKKYRVDLNLHFQKAWDIGQFPDKKNGGYDMTTWYEHEKNKPFPDAEKEETDRVMRARAQKCLDQLNPYLVDKKTGIQIEIHLNKKNYERSVDSYVQNVRISDKSAQIGANHWQADSQCDPIAHEMMHLLGLIDHYPENYGDRDWDEAADRKGQTAGKHQSKYPCQPKTPGYFLMYSNGNFGRFSEDKPALGGAEIRSIVFPRCGKRNPIYYKCAEASRRTALTSEEAAKIKCDDVPKECLDNYKWLD